jgi:tetratricopeptide (TPR) repeat protein
LGTSLYHKGQVDEAITCLKKAVELDPRDVNPLYNLGDALAGKGLLVEAIACYQKVITLDPRNAHAHSDLGVALARTGQADAAIACVNKAIEIDPKYAAAHSMLGAILFNLKRDFDGAIASFKKAIKLDPNDAMAHFNLGNALGAKGRVDDAIACFRKAIELDPKNGIAHGALGEALLGNGRYAEARDATARALELLPDTHPQRAVFSQQLRTCQRFAKLAERLPRLLTGEDKPASAGECLDVVAMCRHKRLHAAAARFTADAFAADPKLADDLLAGHRYNAACHAALAAAGKGEDAAKLDDKEKARLRKQALDWLRADLALRTKQLETNKRANCAAVREALRHWQQDTDLVGIRDAAAIAKLAAKERAACEKLWTDVAALLKTAELRKYP